MKYLSNPDMLLGLMRQMLSGMEVTLPLFFYTLIFSLPLGVIVALMRMVQAQDRIRCPRACASCAARHAADLADFRHLFYPAPAVGASL